MSFIPFNRYTKLTFLIIFCIPLIIIKGVQEYIMMIRDNWTGTGYYK